MASQEPSRALTLNEQRDRTIQTLIGHFAEDRISIEELERRLDKAHRAQQATELDALTADLPVPEAAAPIPQPPSVPAKTAPAVPRPASPAPETVREHQVVVAVMGGVEKKGHWTPARKTAVFAFMGGAELDFREALLPSGVTEVQILVIWGGIEILVRPGTRVDSSGVAIMGAFAHVPGPPVDDPDAPIIRITGLALMGGVEVNVRYPGESARDASARRREEQRRLREERKRLRGK
ncbi:MAG: DUF1707 SHOCT-like domain-containing protein [Longimicrobiales bacterium]